MNKEPSHRHNQKVTPFFLLESSKKKNFKRVSPEQRRLRCAVRMKGRQLQLSDKKMWLEKQKGKTRLMMLLVYCSLCNY